MNKTIIYVHGFRSDGASSKPKKIQKLLPDFKVMTDSFSSNPIIVLDHLKDLYFEERSNEVIFMGTSLGGFYAMYMAVKFNCKSYCINPSLLSHQTLKSQIGNYKTFNLGYDYEFKSDYLEVLKSIHNDLFDRLKKGKTAFIPKVIFNEDDDVIPHTLFEAFKPFLDISYYPKGGHRATNIETIINDLFIKG